MPRLIPPLLLVAMIGFSAGGRTAEAGIGERLTCTIFGEVKQSGTPRHTINADSAAEGKDFAERKAAVYNDLSDRYDFYACESSWYGSIWGILSMSVVLLTAAASLLAAFDIGSWRFGKYVLAVTSAIAALLSTILVQFQIKDTWQLRENGQINVQVLQARVRNIRGHSDTDIDGLSKVQMEAIELERTQATQFFGQIGKGQGSPPSQP